jgi:hypothetical protein
MFATSSKIPGTTGECSRRKMVQTMRKNHKSKMTRSWYSKRSLMVMSLTLKKT